jgi:uncharacterized membrane protein YoaK (UPF0700 family)
MGILNTSLNHVGGQAVSLGFVTGDLNSLAQQLAGGYLHEPVKHAQNSWDTHWRRAALLACVWSSFFAGTALAGAINTRFTAWILLPPALLLFVLAGRENT